MNDLIAIAKYVGKIYKSNQTKEPFKDLMKILTKEKGYEISKDEVLKFVIYRFDDFILTGIQDFKGRFVHIMEQIKPENCWKYGYYLKSHEWALNREGYNFYDYNLEEAILRFYLSEIRWIEYSKLGVDKNFKEIEK